MTARCTLALLAALTAGAARADAVTIDTFSFTDAGFTGAISPGQSGTLSGTFTGVLEANGSIQLADLGSIRLAYSFGGTSLFGYGLAQFFSFWPGSDSTLDIEAPIGVQGVACIGAVAAFGYGQSGGGGVNGEVAGLDTTQGLPVVTLVSSVTIPMQPMPIFGPMPAPQPQPTPNPAGVPEPASVALLGAGLLGLGVAHRRRAHSALGC